LVTEVAAAEVVCPGGTSVWKPVEVVTSVMMGMATTVVRDVMEVLDEVEVVAGRVSVCTGARAGGGSAIDVLVEVVAGGGGGTAAVDVVTGGGGGGAVEVVVPAGAGWMTAGAPGGARAGGGVAVAGGAVVDVVVVFSSSLESSSFPDSTPSKSEALVTAPSSPRSASSAATVEMGTTVFLPLEPTAPAPPAVTIGNPPADVLDPVLPATMGNDGRAAGLLGRILSSSSPESGPDASASPLSSRVASHARWLFLKR